MWSNVYIAILFVRPITHRAKTKRARQTSDKNVLTAATGSLRPTSPVETEKTTLKHHANDNNRGFGWARRAQCFRRNFSTFRTTRSRYTIISYNKTNKRKCVPLAHSNNAVSAARGWVRRFKFISRLTPSTTSGDRAVAVIIYMMEPMRSVRAPSDVRVYRMMSR